MLRASAKLPGRRADAQPPQPGQRNDPTHGIVFDDATQTQLGDVLRSGVRGPNFGRPGYAVTCDGVALTMWRTTRQP